MPSVHYLAVRCHKSKWGPDDMTRLPLTVLTLDVDSRCTVYRKLTGTGAAAMEGMAHSAGGARRQAQQHRAAPAAPSRAALVHQSRRGELAQRERQARSCRVYTQAGGYYGDDKD